MPVTKLDNIHAEGAVAKQGTSLPFTPQEYYGTSNTGDVASVEWSGGEMFFDTDDNLFWIQTNASGTTSAWRKLSNTWAETSSTSTSTSTSSSTSTSTSTSSTTTSA